LSAATSLLALAVLCMPTVLSAQEDYFTANTAKDALKGFGEQFLLSACGLAP
jgi:hypothetical protein